MLKINDFKKNLIILLTTLSIFFSYSYILNFPVRFSFLLALPFLIKDRVLLNRSLIIKSFTLVFIMYVFSYLMFLNLKNLNFNFFNNLDIKKILELGIVFYLIIFVYYYRSLILNNIFLIINIYLCIFFILLIYYFIKNPEYLFWYKECTTGFFKISKFIYTENSHYSLVAVPVIFYFLTNIKKFLNKPFFLLIGIFFILFSLMNTSTTFFALLFTGSIFLIIINKRIFSIENFLIISLLMINLFFYSTSKECVTNYPDKILNFTNETQFTKRFQSHFSGKIATPHSKVFTHGINKIFNTEKLDNSNRTIEIKRQNGTTYTYDGKNYPPNTHNDYNSKNRYNISFSILVYSIINSFESFKKYPFGVGFNQYYLIHEYSFKNFLKDENFYFSDIYSNLSLNFLNLNTTDGGANFSKIFAEFGIFGILLFLMLLYCAFSSKMTIEQKSFLILILIGQILFRGTGYFNNGFILILFLSLSIFFKKNKYKQ